MLVSWGRLQLYKGLHVQVLREIPTLDGGTNLIRELLRVTVELLCEYVHVVRTHELLQ